MTHGSRRRVFFGVACLLLIAVSGADGDQLPKLRVSDNQRFLVKDDGTPFVWIGDTFWHLPY
jgi:hypothetical protein